MMINLDNPQAVYVLAAYAVAVIGLLGLLLTSWREACRVGKALKRIKDPS